MQTDERVQTDLKSWLLGLLPPEESHLLEERLIIDTELYEELHIVEDELIDEYLAGSLTADEREAFESYFMNSPERQEQFRIANALRAYIGDSKQDVSDPEVAKETAHESPIVPVTPADSGGSWFRTVIPTISMAAAALLLVLLASFALLWRSPSPNNSLGVVLTPGVHTREGGSVQTVRVPPGTQYLQIRLKLARNDYEKYRVILVNSSGNVVQTNEDLTPSANADGPTVQFYVDAAQVPPGEYQLKLDGVADGHTESADSYRFIVVTQ